MGFQSGDNMNGDEEIKQPMSNGFHAQRDENEGFVEAQKIGLIPKHKKSVKSPHRRDPRGGDSGGGVGDQDSVEEPADLGSNPFGGTFQHNGSEECDRTARDKNGFKNANGELLSDEGSINKQMIADNAKLKDELRKKDSSLEQQAFQ